MNLLVLVTEAFGGRGGIAKFNCDLLRALCLHPDVEKIMALPRLIREDVGVCPPRLTYETAAARGKWSYLLQLTKVFVGRYGFSGIVCGHLHLLPMAVLAAWRYRAPLILVVHGIEAWNPPRVLGLDLWLRTVHAFASVSLFTKRRFLQWAPLREHQGYVIPDCIQLSRFAPGPKPDYLVRRYHLDGRRVILTVARLSAAERYKGIDEILELMPSLAQEMPDLAYLIVGDGDDRQRLQSKAAKLGIADRIVFAGYVPDDEKVDHYRLANAFVMPGRGEGFGIVYLEAMACGVPVVASRADGSREALFDGAGGLLPNPDSPEEVRAAVKEAIGRAPVQRNRLEHFSFERFVERWHEVLHQTFSDSKTKAQSHAHP
jgi:glycosyltransferase involved in cell wall biosynthesis